MWSEMDSQSFHSTACCFSKGFAALKAQRQTPTELSLTWQHLNIEPVSSGQNEVGTCCSNISEPKVASDTFN